MADKKAANAKGAKKTAKPIAGVGAPATGARKAGKPAYGGKTRR